MLNNITIKARLYILAFISIVGLAVLSFLLINSINSISNLGKANVFVETLDSDMLVLRKHEKDFQARKDLKYKKGFEKDVKVLQNNIKELENILIQYNINTSNLTSFSKIINQYEDIFLNLVDKQQIIGLDHNSGLYGSLRDAVHKVQKDAKEANNNELLAKVYDLRKQEKDFMLRRDLKYVDNFNKVLDSLLSTENLLTAQRIEFLNKYKKDFLALIEAEKILGLDSESGIQGQMRQTVHQTELLLKKMTENISTIIDENISSVKMTAVVIGAVIILFILILSTIIAKTISKRLKEFQGGLLDFFKYLNKEISDVKKLDDTSKDEIGIMAETVNENIGKIKKTIEEDRSAIDDTILVLENFEKGDFTQRVKVKASNPSLIELTNLLNEMGENLEKNIDIVLNILEEYSNNNFLNKVPTEGLKEHILKLASGVNSLGESITEILVENKKSGVTINNSSYTLLENIKVLNTNSNKAAAALEETAAALEEITGNITNNTNSIIKMADYANELTTTAKQGEKLASETTVSMDEINEEVEAINEAITVIDQIAFQTNILSLNAAVEAATAGEAGKGFAVVAQEVRNLASRSAEAAKEIKELVEQATQKANRGKNIADGMIKGYNGLNENISKTIELISDVEVASKEQSSGIQQINNAVNSLDHQTQENASIAAKTQEIANTTSVIAHRIIEEADKKEFRGKNEINTSISKDKPIKNQKAENKISKENRKNIEKKDEEQWESF